MPIIFLCFAWRLFSSEIFGGDLYAMTIYRKENIWLAIFLTAGVLQFLATEFAAENKDYFWYRPMAKIKERFCPYRCFIFRVVMISACGAIFTPWALGLMMLPVARVGLGDIVWSSLSLMSFRLAYRVYHEPIIHEKKC